MSDYIDWYDYDEVEKFNEKRIKQFRAIVKRMSAAKEKGDEAAIKKAYEALSKFRKQNEVYREKAEKAGYCWV